MKGYGLKFIVYLSIIAVQFVVAGAANAQAGAQRGSGPLTLAEAVARALKYNPRLEAARFEVAAAAAQVTQARSGLLPQLDASETYKNTNSPLWAFGTKLNQGAITAEDFDPDRLNDPDAISNFTTALSLTWRLFDGGQTWIAWRQARKNQEAGQLALRRSEQSIIAQTATAYVNSLLAEENRLVVAQALDTARAHLKVVQDRLRSGLAVKSDLLRAQVRISDLEQQLLQAESRIKVAQAVLRAVMGGTEPRGEELMLNPAVEGSLPVDGRLDEWIQLALAQRPDLKQMQLQEEIARSQVDRARAAHYPNLSVQGNYELNSEDFNDSNENYTVGAVLQVNLYSGQRISGQTAEAKAMLSRIRSMRQGLELVVQVDTQKAFYEAQSTWQSIQVAQTAVEQAQEGLRITANRYENGLLALINLLDAQVALQQAQTQLFRAKHDYKVARISLALASGSIDKEYK